MLDKFYSYRFELFLFTQLIILFGSLFIPLDLFENWIMPLFLLINIASGIILLSKKRLVSKLLVIFLAISTIFVAFTFFDSTLNENYNYIKLASYFIFYGFVTIEIVKQVWNAKDVGKNVILGLISGYISLGLLSFFLCLTVEIIYPNSFSGITTHAINIGPSEMSDSLMYYSYITLMTIGYGDILPITPIAQKAAIFIGLIGQFYLVVLTAIVVGKYINQSSKN
ncbi:ion channel [uncultured Winogradskyella sp.]|jgi:voltage-gated potassium channel Kch|uniref:ion channel n=1 Tax=uncultured Winogradskyella sp. TaxID=395353 RepID=UPI0025E3D071|nr:ion channel [uncultured Winogradskyella sp.]